MLDNTRQFEIRVLVNGKPITEYEHQGRQYIEGRRKSTFELEFINHTPGRVLALLSVDGLSIMDGEPAGNESGGYVVDPWSHIRVPGWRLDNSKVAEFVFKDAEQSYSNQSGKGTVNTGVIGCMVWKERRPIQHVNWPNDWVYRSKGTHVGEPAGLWYNASGNILPQNASLHSTSMAASDSMLRGSSADTEENLGTGFGSAADFNTRETHFNRENPQVPNAMMALYYDSAKNLEAKGIKVRPQKKKSDKPVNPNPFPAANPQGCTPPPGWHPAGK